MTTPVPQWFIWTEDGVMRPLNQHAADRAYTVHEHYHLEHREDRSSQAHRHFFACVNEAWLNLRGEADRFSSPDHLRRWALIKAGFRDERSFICSSKAEAQRLAAFLRPMDDYAMVSVSGLAVVVLTAKSQSMRAMGKQEFNESKQKVLDILADLIGVSPDQLGRAA